MTAIGRKPSGAGSSTPQDVVLSSVLSFIFFSLVFPLQSAQSDIPDSITASPCGRSPLWEIAAWGPRGCRIDRPAGSAFTSASRSSHSQDTHGVSLRGRDTLYRAFPQCLSWYPSTIGTAARGRPICGEWFSRPAARVQMFSGTAIEGS